MDPSINSILETDTLRWVFVGGNGGVGKTTNSCSIALQLSKVRGKTLIISTDPAHNLSDAFNQQFGKDPRPVEGVPNLSAMEIDPQATIEEFLQREGGESSTLRDLAFSIPGVDEAIAFSEVLKRVNTNDFDVIVFDTAPTGHTLRFLQFPSIIEKALAKIKELMGSMGPMLETFMGKGDQENGIFSMMSKLDEIRETTLEVNKQFRDPDLTTFVCVCIAEFLSLYETERMIQELTSFGIDTNTIIVNQLVLPEPDETCKRCLARAKLQNKYLTQIYELYEDFHIIEVPLLTDEVRGVDKLEKFSEMLVSGTKEKKLISL